jgi:hypothetical protein
MNEEILEVIRKNLPAQVGETLREVLEKGQKDAEKVAILSEEKSKCNDEIKSLNKIIREFDSKESKYNDLTLRENALLEEQRNLKIKLLEFQNKELEKRTTDMFTLVSLLVKNPRAIEVMNKSVNGTNDAFDNLGCRQTLYSGSSEYGTRELTESKD